ncbi:MAG: hypothetical protein E6Q58_04990 [Niabella sp.]|nr:MAG: hypothetical protein E6Q58_04990 [Niabella sp.]
MKELVFNKWLRWGLINLVFVALYGTLMRYKIAFSFPFFQQKHLLHAHSHFAFSGWISHFIYTALALMLVPYIAKAKQSQYNSIIWINILCSFGMLFSFTAQGYGLVSISFSTLSILISIAYAILFIRDSTAMPANNQAKNWAISGLVLNIISAAGPLFLAYMMMTKNVNSDGYLGSVYYFLHFQYSGWFFFGCMAIVINLLKTEIKALKNYFWVFTTTAIITVFLSLLWLKLPLWLYVITVIATMVQLAAWIGLILKFLPTLKQQLQPSQPLWIKVFLYGAILSMTIKFILQAISVIPSLSQLVFGIRPIVIAYLHLVLLGVYSLFILGFCFSRGFFNPTSFAKKAAIGFFIGVLLNEIFLGIQGMSAFTYTPVPFINELLVLAAFVLFFSAIGMAISQKNTKNLQNP